MAAAKNQKTGKWYSKFRFKDYNGATVQKKKEGFATKREAQEWEADFRAQHEGKERLTFGEAYKRYMADCEKRQKATTLQEKRALYRTNYAMFADMPIADISPAAIRKWQNENLLAIGPDGKLRYAPATIKSINTKLSAVFEYCVRFCGLDKNPVRAAGRISYKHVLEKKGQAKDIWQRDTFERFIDTVKNPEEHLAFGILFWCGLRKGELLGLRIKDIDPKDGIVRVRQNYTEAGVIDTPKTKSSKRDVSMPKRLAEEAKAFIRTLYAPSTNDLLFQGLTVNSIRSRFKRCQERAGITPIIRVHDLRHSHASLLISLGLAIMSRRK